MFAFIVLIFFILFFFFLQQCEYYKLSKWIKTTEFSQPDLCMHLCISHISSVTGVSCSLLKCILNVIFLWSGCKTVHSQDHSLLGYLETCEGLHFKQALLCRWKQPKWETDRMQLFLCVANRFSPQLSSNVNSQEHFKKFRSHEIWVLSGDNLDYKSIYLYERRCKLLLRIWKLQREKKKQL